ncbi:transcription factor 7-like 2 [Octopus sinensis]|uniref:Transcription factor 7-like 2 n=1 Tax=Octopus sinensis TaxID=2607531 RepID=A0A6P7U5K8_9MOLL|nr:transcription factor 7-like 2 [Octopus sinensis]
MPHVSSGGSEDFFSKDEVKVYKDEGEEEKRSSENLSEDKLGLVTESEEGKNSSLPGQSYPGGEKSNTSGRPEDGMLSY